MWLSGLQSWLEDRIPVRNRSRKRQGPHRWRFSSADWLLEDRCLPAVVVPIPATNPEVELSKIFWNGGPPLNPNGLEDIPAPYEVGAAKSITLTNNSDDTIFPFVRGANIGRNPISQNAPYDPQDLMQGEFRQYVGYSQSDGSQYLGLPQGTSITFQLPLVMWDGGNLYLATDGTHLTTSDDIFGYDAGASISIADSTTPHSGTIWVTASSNFPAGTSPLVMFYYSNGDARTPSPAAPAQLTEFAFRDQYLKHFIDDPSQTYPLINYDVSYVDHLVAPVAMAASHVPITVGNIQNTVPPGPKYFGYEDLGWLATDLDTKTFENRIEDFVKNKGKASIGQYFDGRGWPEYYNPNSGVNNIPAGSNLFANSPLTTDRSPYDNNRWLLTSNGEAPIQAGGGGFGQQGIVHVDSTNRIFLNLNDGGPSKQFVSDLKDMLKNKGVVDVFSTGTNPQLLATVTAFEPNPDKGLPYVTLSKNITPSGESGAVYAFIRPVSDYAVTAITNLWYSWAQFHVSQYENFQPQTVQGTLQFNKDNHVTNEIILDTAPQTPLAPGMTVTSGAGVLPPKRTTILRVEGNHVFLSQIPAQTTPGSAQFTFSKPEMLEYDPQSTTPFTLEFSPEETPNAKLFAASVYEAMAAEAVGLPDTPHLPFAMRLVSQVIQFYAKIPGHELPTGPSLVAQVRDIVKSILRGVYDFNKVPDQTQWYPDPKTPTGGQKFNVYNLDPYVWFVHTIEEMSGYGFSVDDDVANPSAPGPILGPAPDFNQNHFPSNLQIGFGGIGGFGNQKQWFPTIPWGSITTTATIKVQQGGEFDGASFIELQDPDALKFFNQINNPGSGQVGAYVSAPGHIVPGTTLIHKGPTSVDIPQIVLSQNAISTDTPIPITIFAGLLDISTVPVGNAGFEAPRQTSPPFFTVNPKGGNVKWDFTGTAGIAGSGSDYTKHNPAPAGTQVGFIQNEGSISQTVRLLPDNAYAASFLVAQRLLDDGSLNAQTLEVRIDDKVIGTLKPGSSSYELFTSDAFTVTRGGKYTLTITGTNRMGGDNTALIDEVTVTGKLPPPHLFVDSRGLYENHFGGNEKWLRGDTNQFNNPWYYILPGGDMFAWNGTAELSGELLTNLGARGWENPELLVNAAPNTAANPVELHAADQARAFYRSSTGNFWLNAFGGREKWIKGKISAKSTANQNNPWYYILPDGRVHEWDGTPGQLTGAQVAAITPDGNLWEQPFLLYDAFQDATVNSSGFDQLRNFHFASNDQSVRDLWENYDPNVEAKWFLGDGGNWYFVKPDGKLFEWDGVRFSATGTELADLGPNAWNNIERVVEDFRPALNETQKENLIALDKQHSLFRASNDVAFYFDFFGRQEKWLYGKGNSEHKPWYILLPNLTLLEWDGTTAAAGKEIANNLPQAVYDNPLLLADAYADGSVLNNPIPLDPFKQN